ncbi:hypothetical protein Cni_G04239 [Canna indica]|uniref:Bifunctional inhibitor/plant lipid transfer protein/seed storage helical domain-containing protein n=1 Tax=Canna indica TaxID=4628 RepID=A0AAQ3JT63_9LILI|nr:hypothetical protein Cni_G04239 [Canna indica]
MARDVSVLCFMFFALTLVVAYHAKVGESCEVNYKMLFSLCQDSIKIAGQDVPPSSDCCVEVNKAGFACIYSNMPQDVDRIVSIKKFIDVCKVCTKETEIPATCDRFSKQLYI